MDFDFLRSATASSSAYRVVCGEMIIDSNMWNVHNEVLVAVVRDGYMTVEMGADTYSLSTGDIYFISPNQRYKINNTGNARVDVILLNLSNPASLTQEFIPQSLIRGLVTGNCTHFAKVTRGDYRYNNLIDLSLITHLRAHETGRNLVCRLLLEKKKKKEYLILRIR